MTPEEFDAATILTVGQIASIVGYSENRTLIRILKSGGVRVLRPSYWHVVEKGQLREAMPAFYEALVSRLRARDD